MVELEDIISRIETLKKTAEELMLMSEGLPALQRNTIRILAGIKMLELNFSEPAISSCAHGRMPHGL